MFRVCLKILCCLLIFLASDAIGHDGVRPDVNWDAKNNLCSLPKLEFNPVLGSDLVGLGNPDIAWEFDNPTCIGFLTGNGIALSLAQKYAGMACNDPFSVTAGDASAATGGAVSPLSAVMFAVLGAKAGMNAASGNYSCLIAFGIQASAYAAAMSTLASIYGAAQVAYEGTRICGHDWYGWTQKDVRSNSSKKDWVKGQGPYQVCLKQLFNGADSSSGGSISDLINKFISGEFFGAVKTDPCVEKYGMTPDKSSYDIKNKFYREYIYGGIEYEDNGSNICENPNWDTDKRMRVLGYTNRYQRYYFNGPGSAPAFACHRFLADGSNDSEGLKAFDCCKKRSQNVTCFENSSRNRNNVDDHNNYIICEKGSRCSMNSVLYEVYASKKQPNYLCAKTYSVCPYNHPLGGGTEDKDPNPSDTSLISNFCQYMNHCTKIPNMPNIKSSSMTGDFISSSCKDMKGDSQNVYGYTSQLLPINSRGFSAPIIQCFKETMENVFLNRAGNSKCLNSKETPDKDGNCSGGYIHKKGDTLPGKSFFLKMQDSLRGAVKIALSFAIIIFGMGILLGMSPIEKKVLLPLIMKLGLVIFFVLGDGWQMGFIEGVNNASLGLANVVFKIDVDENEAKRDGCQFPRFNYADEKEETRYKKPSYPPGKAYLAIWDTLDCKIARALGFTPEVSVPNIVLMIVGGFFTGGLGLIFVLGSFLFAAFLILMTMRAIHTFLLSMTMVILLLYVSPITITCSLFGRTKGIFDGWLKKLIQCVLQPVVLFVMLGLVITVFDKIIIGDVSFSGDGLNAPKKIECGNPTFAESLFVNPFTDLYNEAATAYNSSINEQINKLRSGESFSTRSTTQIAQDVGANMLGAISNVPVVDTSKRPKPNDSSIYCIFRVSDISTFNGLEAIGIGVPMLVGMTKEKMQTILKAAVLMFILMMVLDQVGDITKKLIGSSDMVGSSFYKEAMSKTKEAYELMKGVQTRGMNASRKYGGKIARGGVEKINKFGNKGKGSAVKDSFQSKVSNDQDGKPVSGSVVGSDAVAANHIASNDSSVAGGDKPASSSMVGSSAPATGHKVAGGGAKSGSKDADDSSDDSFEDGKGDAPSDNEESDDSVNRPDIPSQEEGKGDAAESAKEKEKADSAANGKGSSGEGSNKGQSKPSSGEGAASQPQGQEAGQNSEQNSPAEGGNSQSESRGDAEESSQSDSSADQSQDQGDSAQGEDSKAEGETSSAAQSSGSGQSSESQAALEESGQAQDEESTKSQAEGARPDAGQQQTSKEDAGENSPTASQPAPAASDSSGGSQAAASQEPDADASSTQMESESQAGEGASSSEGSDNQDRQGGEDSESQRKEGQQEQDSSSSNAEADDSNQDSEASDGAASSEESDSDSGEDQSGSSGQGDATQAAPEQAESNSSAQSGQSEKEAAASKESSDEGDKSSSSPEPSQSETASNQNSSAAESQKSSTAETSASTSDGAASQESNSSQEGQAQSDLVNREERQSDSASSAAEAPSPPAAQAQASSGEQSSPPLLPPRGQNSAPVSAPSRSNPAMPNRRSLRRGGAKVGNNLQRRIKRAAAAADRRILRKGTGGGGGAIGRATKQRVKVSAASPAPSYRSVGPKVDSNNKKKT